MNTMMPVISGMTASRRSQAQVSVSEIAIATMKAAVPMKILPPSALSAG